MPICEGCGKDTDFTTYYQGKYYCEDCYRTIREKGSEED